MVVTATTKAVMVTEAAIENRNHPLNVDGLNAPRHHRTAATPTASRDRLRTIKTLATAASRIPARRPVFASASPTDPATRPSSANARGAMTDPDPRPPIAMLPA